MTTTSRSFVIAAFSDNNQAQQAIKDLQHAGFSDDQIRYSVNRGGGGITDDLVKMGIPQQEAGYYNQEFEQGHTIVTVDTHDQQQQAYTILAQDGGTDFNTSRGRTSTYTSASGGTAATATTASAAGEVQEQEIPLRAEELQPTARWTQVGEVDITKDVVSEQQTINVPVSREEVVIERHPGSGQVSDTPIATDEEQTLRIPVSEEKVGVTKETVTTGEVTVGKRRVQEQEQISDTVKKEELRVDQRGEAPIHGTTSDPYHPGQATVEDLLQGDND